MLFNFNRLAASGIVAALTLGVAFAAGAAQKANAQLVGAGASSITDLAPFIRNTGNRYVITDNGTGLLLFQSGVTDFVATDFNPGSYDFDTIVFNEANLRVAFPYNVPGFDGQLTSAQGCGIINGTITDWNQIVDPTILPDGSLPIIRVARGDNNGTSAALQNTLIKFICNDDVNGLRLDIQAFDENSGAFVGFGNDNVQGDGIVVAPSADPFNSGDDYNSGSYSLGVINTVQNNLGAISYVEDALVINRGIPLASSTDTGESTIVVGPTYVVFRRTYDTQQQADAATAVCLAATDTDNLLAAGFDPTPVNLLTGHLPNGEIGNDAVSGGNPACNNIAGPGSVDSEGQ